MSNKKIMNEEDRFVYLIKQEKHRATCLEAIRLGRPLTPWEVKSICRCPEALERILEMGFGCKAYGHHAKDKDEIFKILCEHFGRGHFFKKVLHHKNLWFNFLPYFSSRGDRKVLEGYLGEILKADKMLTAENFFLSATALHRKLKGNMNKKMYDFMRQRTYILSLKKYFSLPIMLEYGDYVAEGGIPSMFLAKSVQEHPELLGLIKKYPKAYELLKETQIEEVKLLLQKYTD